MAKIKYNREEVLDNAIELFWEKGYTASSMQQVVKATGLQPGSIYLAFKNKEGLFKEALKRYAELTAKNFQQLISTTDDVDQALCQLLEQKIEATTKDGYCSCFLVKSLLELSAAKNSLSTFVLDQLKTIEKLIYTNLQTKYDEKTSENRAVTVMMHIFGIRVYGYFPESADDIKKSLKESLSWLPWNETF